MHLECITVGDMLTGQDGNKYVVCDEAGVSYWKPVQTKKEKDNDMKPKFEYDDVHQLCQMIQSLKPKVSPNKFPTGYVWTTKFSNISYIIDTEYKGSSMTMSRFWKFVFDCPPCVNAKNYPINHVYGRYYVDCEQGNKFWCYSNFSNKNEPYRREHKFPEGTTCTGRDGKTYVSRRNDEYHPVLGSAYWESLLS